MKKRAGVSFVFASFLLLCGCSPISGKLLVMEANYRLSRGLFAEAIAAYQKAHEYEEAAAYSEFGLGSVYYALGEEKAALDRFADAGRILEAHSPAENRELRYRIHYNTGVVLFSGGDFSGAADSFRKALETDGGKKDAKRNLELSIQSLARENASSGGGADEGEMESRASPKAALFEYIRQKELNQWKSREWEEEDASGPDY